MQTPSGINMNTLRIDDGTFRYRQWDPAKTPPRPQSTVGGLRYGGRKWCSVTSARKWWDLRHGSEASSEEAP